MHIEELKEGCFEGDDEGSLLDARRLAEIEFSNTKRALVGVAGRVLFYPTLFYNVVRNKIQSEFRWWDAIDEFVLLGAIPFPSDVPRLKQLGVHGVITLNEPYETLVPTALYKCHAIDHLVIPTRDYLFAPSFVDICEAVGFIHRNSSCGRTTYVHCKAGRGRSTTIVLCYLVQHKQMAPRAAYDHVRKIRPRVLLAPSQWQAVEDYYHFIAMKIGRSICLDNSNTHALICMAGQNDIDFDDSSVVVVTESDLDGYDGSCESRIVGNKIWAEVRLVCKSQFSGQAALARLSCFWLPCNARQKLKGEKLIKGSCKMEADQLGVGADIPVY